MEMIKEAIEHMCKDHKKIVIGVVAIIALLIII